MAEEDDDLDLSPADAGALFRAEMATTNFLLGYWKGLLALLVAGLVGILLYGKYRDIQIDAQKGWASEVARQEVKLGVPLIALPQALEAGEIDKAKLASHARAMLEVARQGKGAARVEAGLKAAELFRLADLPEERRAALDDALPHAEGVLAYSAVGALANLDLEQGDGDAAAQRWQSLIASEDGLLAEQAMLELGLVYEALDRPDDARKVYADFMAKFPDSTRYEKAAQRDARLAASNG